MKTAMELGITQQEYDALKWVSESLKSGEITWYRGVDELTKLSPTGSHKLFNMGVIVRRFKRPFSDDSMCATVGCIGGWMAMRMGIEGRWDVVDYVNNRMSQPLYGLCFPIPARFDGIRAPEAIKAIDNFFQCGFPIWGAVIGPLRAEQASPRIEEERVGATVNLGTTDRAKIEQRLNARLAQRQLEKVDAGE